MSLQKESEWEKEFNREFPYCALDWAEGKDGHPKDIMKDIKSFIRKVLSNREHEIAEEVEKMRYTREQIKDIGLAWQGHPCIGANDAIDKVLSILKH